MSADTVDNHNGSPACCDAFLPEATHLVPVSNETCHAPVYQVPYMPELWSYIGMDVL